ncbi:single-stranded-DNA-specific exonuclease RecJ [bacterium]|nr:single-stranded-DNA-specific exonuclease RecJ [bacterium]
MPRRRWIELPRNDDSARRLAKALDLTPLAATVLAQRGFADAAAAATPRPASGTTRPRPVGVAGLARAVELILDALDKRDPICVYGDYDVDGTTATALLLDVFEALGHPAFYALPERDDHGYGFHASIVEAVVTRGAKLIITVDTGITGHEACETARRLGARVIVTDHHELPETMPCADAIVNPHQAGCAFAGHALAGVGIAFFLAGALRAELARRGVIARDDLDLRDTLDLVALGTVADLAPITGVNRILVTAGLARLDQRKRPGVAALAEVAGLSGKRMTCGHIGFALGPRLNAAGRLASAAAAVDLLRTRDGAEAARLSEALDRDNNRRRQIEQSILDRARRVVEDVVAPRGMFTLVVPGDGWHHGVVGIVASRIVDEFHRPAIVIGFDGDQGRGSGRSIGGFDLFAAVNACGGHLEKFGGHAQAVGLTIQRENLEPFMAAFETHARSHLRADDLLPSLQINAVCPVDEADERTARQIDRMAPFGIGNPTPVLATRGARVVHKEILKGQHLKLRLATAGSGAVTAMGWRMADRYGDVAERVDIAFTLGINEFNGRRDVQFTIRDF